MPASRRAFAILGLIVAISAALIAAGDKKPKPKSNATSAAPTPMQMDDDKRIVHALNRFTFGIRPGDVERVRAIGLDKWFDQQLHPEKIEDSVVEARLAPLRTLKMSTREMVENFPPPQILKQVENGRMSMPSDPAKRAIYQSRILAMQENQAKKQDGGNPNNTAKSSLGAASEANEMKADGDMKADAPADAKMTPEQQKQQFHQRDAA